MANLENLLEQAMQIQTDIAALNQERREAGEVVCSRGRSLINSATMAIADVMMKLLSVCKELDKDDEQLVIRWVLTIVTQLQIARLNQTGADLEQHL